MWRRSSRNVVPTTWPSSCVSLAARSSRQHRKQLERPLEYDCPCFWSHQGMPSAQPRSVLGSRGFWAVLSSKTFRPETAAAWVRATSIVASRSPAPTQIRRAPHLRRQEEILKELVARSL